MHTAASSADKMPSANSIGGRGRWRTPPRSTPGQAAGVSPAGRLLDPGQGGDCMLAVGAPARARPAPAWSMRRHRHGHLVVGLLMFLPLPHSRLTVVPASSCFFGALVAGEDYAENVIKLGAGWLAHVTSNVLTDIYYLLYTKLKHN